MTLYIVVRVDAGSYETYDICLLGVFSTRENAESEIQARKIADEKDPESKSLTEQDPYIVEIKLNHSANISLM